jgi:tetratricopeptide (TPR) repeat protein
LRLFYSVGGRHDRGRAIGEELVQLAHDLQDPTLWSDANNALGIPLFWIGDWSQAQQHIERGLSGRPLLPNQSSIFLLSGVSCQGYLAWLSWLLGYPAQAVEKVKSILALAEETTHPFTQSNALTFAAMLGQFSREPQDTQRYADQSITISGDYGFTMFLSWGNILKGWSLGEQGFQAEGIAQIRQGLTAWQATGARFSQPYFLALLAEEYGKSHQYEEGLAAISEALTIVTQNNEHMYEAELYRLKGELLLRQAEQSR